MGLPIRRRPGTVARAVALVATVCAGTLYAGPAAEAPRPAAETRTVCILLSRDLPGARDVVDGFKAGLDARGVHRYVELALKDEPATDLRRRIAEGRPDLVFAVGPEAARLAFVQTSDVPVLFAMVSNPVDAGLLATRSEPGQRAAGVACEADPRQQFDLLRQVLPQARRVAVVYCPPHTGGVVAAGEEAAKSLGLELVRVPIEPFQVDAATDRLERAPVDALWAIPDPGVLVPAGARRLLTWALANRVPVLGYSAALVRAGTLAALCPDPAGMGRQAGTAAAAILHGGKTPADIHLIYPQKTGLYLNLALASRLGLRLPEELTSQAEGLHEGTQAVGEPDGTPPDAARLEPSPLAKPVRIITTGENRP